MHMSRRRLRTELGILFGVGLLTACLVGGLGVVGATPADGAEAVTETGSLLQSETPASNGSRESNTLPPPHRNPADVEASGNLQQLQAVLGGSIDRQLASSIENLDGGDYERAREQLGDEFETTLRQYASSATNLDSEAQAEQILSFDSDLEAYISAVEAYNTTRSAYESAQQSGDRARSRALGRELIRDAERVTTTGQRVVDSYRVLNRSTDQDFSEQIARIEQRRATASRTADTVAAEEFTTTSLSVTANRSTVAFTDRIRLTGSIETADGSSVGSRQATFRVQERNYTVDVAPTGDFEFVVDPSTVWRTADELRVSYRPGDDTALLGSNATLPLSVSTTETRVRIDSISGQASYDKPVVLSGTLRTTATGQPVPETPVSVRFDGTEIGITQTDSTGQFTLESRLPADFPVGETVVEVGPVASSRAVMGDDTDARVRITATDPVLTVNATVVEAGNAETRLSVDGRLLSPDGRPVTGEDVAVSIGDTVVGEVTTNSEGAFTAQFAPPDGAAAGSELPIEATFDPDSSNLNAATGSTTILLPETLFESIGLSSTDTRLLGILAVVGFLGVVGGAAGWLVRTPTHQQRTPDQRTVSSTGEAAADATDLLRTATAQLEAGADETAATAAYVAARRSLGETVDVAETATHWEWYHACAAAGVDHLSELETLVAAFEQVTFAPDEEANAAAATRAVSTAREFVDADH